MEAVTLEVLPQGIDIEEVKRYLTRKGIKYHSVNANKEIGKANIIVTYKIKDIPDMTVFEDIDMKLIPNTTSQICVSYGIQDVTNNSDLQPKEGFRENEEIGYLMQYHEHIITQFVRCGREGLKFNDLTGIDIQRKLLQRYRSKVGFDLMSKSSLLALSLPISIFDQRSLLEVFAQQCRLSPFYLEKAGLISNNPIEVLKLTTAFFISKLHLSVTQLKPFNPFIGETFQCKIDDSMLYLERPSEQSLDYNFYHLGKHFKCFGHQQHHAVTIDNGISVSTIGDFTVCYPNGTTIKIIPCDMTIKGIINGERMLSLSGKCYIVDEGNNYLAYIDFDREGRECYPDKFKGYILRLDQAKHNTQNDSYTLDKNYTSLVEINGYWTKQLVFDDDVYWNYYEYLHYPLKRMKYTLPSDSTQREDIKALRMNQPDLAKRQMAYLEHMQRKDKQLRLPHSTISAL